MIGPWVSDRVLALSGTPKSHDSADIETGVRKFVDWVRSGKLEIKAHASENLHAKVYIMTFAEGDRDKGRVITGSSKTDHDQYFKTVQSNSKTIRAQVLKYLMIRRTRTEIVKYYGEDLKLQGLKFPNVTDPQPLFYKFSKTENEVFFETIRLLTKDFAGTSRSSITKARSKSSRSRASATSESVLVRTNLWQSKSAPERERLYESVGKSLPVGRVGEAHDVAQAYLFLMEEGFSTGQTVVVDGGTVLV